MGLGLVVRQFVLLIIGDRKKETSFTSANHELIKEVTMWLMKWGQGQLVNRNETEFKNTAWCTNGQRMIRKVCESLCLVSSGKRSILELLCRL